MERSSEMTSLRTETRQRESERELRGCLLRLEVEEMVMKPMRVFLVWTVVLSAVAAAQDAKPQAPPAPPTIASAVDREISYAEKEIVEAAQAMPENKFDFSPESLNIPGSNYKGVRSFAAQVKHIGASNYLIWSPVTRDKLPDAVK